jgi:hypothetical protein
MAPGGEFGTVYVGNAAAAASFPVPVSRFRMPVPLPPTEASAEFVTAAMMPIHEHIAMTSTNPIAPVAAARN